MIEKRIIKNLIIEKQNEIPEISLIKRPLNLEPAVNYVFVGLRRAGKSYMMYQHIQTLIQQGTILKDNVLYVNCEDERITPINAENLGLFLDCHQEMYGVRPWIFLDKVQNVAGWEKFVHRLVDSKYKVCITGNDATMLSKEIYTTFGGRCVAHEILPFSFSEYLLFHGIVLTLKWEYENIRTRIGKLFHEYFYYGGFVESTLFRDKRNWINSLYQTVILGDVIFRNDIRNENAIRILVKKLAESVMQPLTIARIKTIVDSTGINIARNTLVDYIRFLEDAYLIFCVPNFSDKLNNKEPLKKRYLWNNGLLNNFLFESETKLLENIVAIALRKQYKDDLYFYNHKHKHNNIEVDFFIPRERRAVQVSYSIDDPTTRQKEVEALLKLSELYPLDKAEIVTWDEGVTINEKGLSIRAIPAWKFLLIPDIS
jgi:predicted AAA+ superfamily ATPase